MRYVMIVQPRDEAIGPVEIGEADPMAVDHQGTVLVLHTAKTKRDGRVRRGEMCVNIECNRHESSATPPLTRALHGGRDRAHTFYGKS
ncbi:MAG TPA: hypothetical protein VF440_08410 [Novosphingobium sp.]